MIDKSNDLSSIQHESKTGETYGCCVSTRNVRQPKFEKSQSYNSLHFIQKSCLTVVGFQKQKGRST